MTRLYGSRFAPCVCGRKAVLMYSRDENGHDVGNGPDADRLTYHDTPDGVSCAHGGERIARAA